MPRLIALFLLAAALAPAQTLRIYSEFRRIDPFGEVAVPDRGGEPAEILSPMLVRNSWNSFQIACTVPEGPSYLYLQQNPELFEVKVYRQIFVDTPKGWIPDRLEPVELPYMMELPDSVNPIPKQTTVVFWLDLWVPAYAPPGRTRVQAVMKSGDLWLVYPMEVRVQEALVRGEFSDEGPLLPETSRADTALMNLLRGRLCAARDAASPVHGLTVRGMLRRNALRDLSLARYDLTAVLDESGHPLRSFCSPGAAGALPPEWWLSVRRRLYRKPPAN